MASRIKRDEKEVILKKDEKVEYFDSIKEAWSKRLRKEDDDDSINKSNLEEVENAIEHEIPISEYYIYSVRDGFLEYLREEGIGGAATKVIDAFYTKKEERAGELRKLGINFQQILSKEIGRASCRERV